MGGQSLEWPQVVPEGKSLEHCREALQDAIEQMVLAYKEQVAVPPVEHSLFEPIPVETVQMTLDEELVEQVDRLAKRMHTTRSAFTREALRQALDRSAVERLEQRQKEGYERFPVIPGEFSDWEDEQVWDD